MKTGLAVALVLIAIAALIAYSTFSGRRYRVTVCMAYQGRTACRTVSGKSQEGALRGGVENACGDIASGVTDTIACGQMQPQSIKWLSKP